MAAAACLFVGGSGDLVRGGGIGTAAASSLPTVDVPGIAFTGTYPPDSVGDVGPAHYVQVVNSSVAIYNKQGTLLTGPFTLSSFFTGIGSSCAAPLFNPSVLYDEAANRWLVGTGSGAGQLCVGVSQSADPNGAWYLYSFATPEYSDFPRFGVGPKAYSVTTNESTPVIYALDRSAMLAGSAATNQRFAVASLAGFGFQALAPSDIDGVPAPTGAPQYFLRHRDDEVHSPGSSDPTRDFLDLYSLDVNFASPGSSVLLGPIAIPVAEFDSDLCGLTSRSCFAQPGTMTRLDPLREIVLSRLQYRNFGSHESLVGTFVVDVGDEPDHGGIRWFELRKVPAGAWALYQEGLYAPDGHDRFTSSLALDANGNAALGFTTVSETLLPAIRYTSRRAGSPLGSMPGVERQVIQSATAQTASNRWGNTSTVAVDPADGRTFWYTNQYVTAGGNWATRIAAFTVPEPESGAAGLALLAALAALSRRRRPGRLPQVAARSGSCAAISISRWYASVSTGVVPGTRKRLRGSWGASGSAPPIASASTPGIGRKIWLRWGA